MSLSQCDLEEADKDVKLIFHRGRDWGKEKENEWPGGQPQACRESLYTQQVGYLL